METRRKQSTEQIAYLAGVIDSDGYIGIVKGPVNTAAGGKIPVYTLTVNVTNTSLPLMEWLVENFGGKYYCRKTPTNANWKQTYNWINSNQKAKAILELVKDYLVVKTPQTLVGLELMDNWVTNKHGTSQEELNRREKLYQASRDITATGLVQRERLNSKAPSLPEG